ncbi:hypothetical protein [Bradyrhizobium paxllaeri]|uniref:hypothetical protein n=1 Tax=Bradyrhizobium paxllaeri TaxID=190148 RepID=UPI000810E246|nr:hypothetical protein [Bradyrhizobium paxllaeri]
MAAIVAIGAWVLWPKPAAFAQKEVDKIKEDIRTEFSRGESLKVIEVQLIREDDRKLAGFVKLEVEALAELKSLRRSLRRPITKECMASMDENWHVAEHDFY